VGRFVAQMKTILICFFVLVSAICVGQDGLEGVFVERYYVTSKSDTSNSLATGIRSEGLVTYRVFVDLKPGYTFQAAYGAPGHPLFLRSSEKFYNHPGAGTVYSNILPEKALNRDKAYLDSWVSVGAAGENLMGVPKVYDDTLRDPSLQLGKTIFLNKSKKAGIPLSEKDGVARGENIPFATLYQLETALNALGTDATGNEVLIENGAWACMGIGAKGVDSLTTNCVLIAQLTTSGSLEFELNLLIGAPNGTSQKYVAKNPDLGEWLHDDLIFSTLDRKDKRNKGKLNKKGTRK
jgi:hypothetical protein